MADGLDNTDIELEDTSNTATIIIVVVVLLIIILIVTGALIYYSKKNSVWCYKESQQGPEDKFGIDSESQKPLQNQPPILKPGLRRPQT